MSNSEIEVRNVIGDMGEVGFLARQGEGNNEKKISKRSVGRETSGSESRSGKSSAVSDNGRNGDRTGIYGE